ncbi:MAG: hypothetical protein HS132_13040 [Planctomycetia bacterium]|nr:hypothetical protein [Planctomycetia bacterium]
MHNIDNTQQESEIVGLEADQFEYAFEGDQEMFGEADMESPFTEAEEMELAAELLEISSEAELDQFLGKLFKGAWRGLKKVGSVVGKVARPLGGVLKGLAKKALPFVGGALGSFIPIPGWWHAVGTALGSAVSKALEVEFEGMNEEDQEFEMARRFVRLAGTAAKQVAQTTPGVSPRGSEGGSYGSSASACAWTWHGIDHPLSCCCSLQLARHCAEAGGFVVVPTIILLGA